MLRDHDPMCQSSRPKRYGGSVRGDVHSPALFKITLFFRNHPKTRNPAIHREVSLSRDGWTSFELLYSRPQRNSARYYIIRNDTA